MSEAAHQQNGATVRVVQESAAAGATTATVRDRGRLTEKMSVKVLGEVVTEAGLELDMTVDEIAMIEGVAGTIAPASTTVHHNHQKALVAVLAARLAAL